MNGPRRHALLRRPSAAVVTMLRRPRSARTHMNAVEIEQAISDLALQPFDAAEFPCEHNDEVLERIYIGRRFKSDTEQLEKRFAPYTKMMVAAAKAPAKQAARKASA